MRRSALALFSLLACVSPLAGQQTDPPPGIRLSGTYDVARRPLLAVRPLGGGEAISEAVDSIGTIIERDLAYSDRFNMVEAIPVALRSGDVDYAQWNSLNVVYLVTGEVRAEAGGYELSLTVHDVVYRRTLTSGRYALPPTTDPRFRMAVHALSDEIVRRAVNGPGSAATRIAFTRQNRGAQASYDLLVVDSDGFGLQRVTGSGGQLYSPSWSPDGGRLLYAMNGEDGWRLVERNLASGTERVLNPGGDLVMTPAYAPDGRSIALGVWRGDRSELAVYDLARGCCLRRISGRGRNIEMYPSYSPDGRALVFMSDRIGRNAIYVIQADGSGATMLSPFVAGQASDYAAPAWSPTGSQVAFHGVWNRRMRGAYQIMVADATRPGAQIEQITTRGNNEDPSWAPDGRHLVYTGVGDGPGGLYVIDLATKKRRLLAGGDNMRMAEWSPPLVRAADLIARP